MLDKVSLLKALKPGDLVYCKTNYKSETSIHTTRSGIIIELTKPTAMGFHMVTVLWDDTRVLEVIAENYLHKIDEKA